MTQASCQPIKPLKLAAKKLRLRPSGISLMPKLWSYPTARITFSSLTKQRSFLLHASSSTVFERHHLRPARDHGPPRAYTLYFQFACSSRSRRSTLIATMTHMPGSPTISADTPIESRHLIPCSSSAPDKTSGPVGLLLALLRAVVLQRPHRSKEVVLLALCTRPEQHPRPHPTRLNQQCQP